MVGPTSLTTIPDQLQPLKTLKTLKTMKLPAAPAPSTEFKNAEGSTVPKEFALAARKNPDNIKEMAETPSEKRELEKEALARSYAIVIDRSGSMTTGDGSGTRWDSAKKAVEQLVGKVLEYDLDGSVPLYLFDHEVESVGDCTSPSQVLSVFNDYPPRRGTTNLAPCLETVLGKYAGNQRENYENIPGLTVVVILDGTTDNNQAVRDVMKKYADPANGFCASHTELAISFVQIGNDPGATAFLKELDEGVAGKPDICDTLLDNDLFAPGGVEKCLYNAIFD